MEHVIIDNGPGKGYKNLIQKSYGPEAQQSKDTMMLSLSHDQKDLSINPDTQRVCSHQLFIFNIVKNCFFIQG